MGSLKTKILEGKISVIAHQRYSWCSCGLSKNQPLCDGTHKEEGDSQPIRIWFDKDQTIFFSRENGKLQLRINGENKMSSDKKEDLKRRRPVAPKFYPTSKFGMKLFTGLQALVYKISRGRFWKTIRGYEICVVNMKGAKTGKLRSIPLMHVPYENGVVLVASLGGADIHPTWYWNLKANPEIKVYVGHKKLDLIANQVDDFKKKELWPLICSCYPDYDNYQKRTKRNIPVFNCQPS